ncbi:MAG: tRNA pseudouridine(55) synthase TruB [Gammaproteobacteria bacterium]|nr:tRNA pseudouridine(55) synthase TruB [Gammaproteobacteria bacterium]
MIDGVLLFDKPSGVSSTAAGLRLRRLLGVRKVGHVGSLDPLATGMLPICVGEATKLASEILEGDKVYRFQVSLGSRTSTGDVEGEITEQQRVPALDRETVHRALSAFLGDTSQIPPMYSAIKQGGVPLYRRARAGEVVARLSRSIRIESLELLSMAERQIECRVVCGKGTYVRVLAENIAKALGTVGHVTELRRESVRPFAADRLVTLQQIESTRGVGLPWVSLDEAVGHLKLVTLAPEAARRMSQGQVVEAPDALLFDLGELVRLHGPGAVFRGLGRVAAPGRVAPKRLVAEKTRE